MGSCTSCRRHTSPEGDSGKKDAAQPLSFSSRGPSPRRVVWRETTWHFEGSVVERLVDEKRGVYVVTVGQGKEAKEKHTKHVASEVLDKFFQEVQSALHAEHNSLSVAPGAAEYQRARTEYWVEVHGLSAGNQIITLTNPVVCQAVGRAFRLIDIEWGRSTETRMVL